MMQYNQQMEQPQKKNSLMLRSKYRTMRPHSQTRPKSHWQAEDYKITQAIPPYKCLCSICYKQQLKIDGVLTEKFPTKISVDKTRFLFSCLVSKGRSKPLNILIVDSCFYHQARPQRIFYSEKGLIVETKSKEISEQYVFNRLVEETKIQNTQNATSLLSRSNKVQNGVPCVSARYCNVLIPKYSQFNETNKSIFNVRVYRKGDAPDFTARKQNDQNFSTIVYYKDKTMVLLSQGNFDKMMKDRREGNPHVLFIQSYVKPKLSSKKNYYGILVTNYNLKQKYLIKTGLYESARANVIKYLDKDPFALDNISEDSLGVEDLATYYMYRIIEYLKETQDIVVKSITLAWMYSVNNQLFLSYCSELEYDFQQKIEIWKTQANYTRKRSKSKVLSQTISDQSAVLYEKWKSIKVRYKEKSMEKVQNERKLWTDKSETIFNLMYPDGDFKTLTLKADSSKSSRLSKTASSFKQSALASSLRMRTARREKLSSTQKFSRTVDCSNPSAY